MLQALKELIDRFLPEMQPDAVGPDAVALASAVLLVEVMRADAVSTPQERAMVVAALRDQFGLSEAEAQALVDRAVQAALHATDTFTFTSRINDAFDVPHKIALVESLWRVAYADGELAADENHLLGKLAELLYLPPGAYIHAKLRAREAVASANRARSPD
jgi:uncharacterized tellurite resistance protein B-like protein